MHLVVFACGVFGYVSTLVVSRYLFQLRVASQAANERHRLCSELDELRAELQDSQVVREQPQLADDASTLQPSTPRGSTQDMDCDLCVEEEACVCELVAPEVATSPAAGPQAVQLPDIPECSEISVQAGHQQLVQDHFLPKSTSYGGESAELSTADEGLSSSWEAVSTDDSWEEEEESEPEALEARVPESPMQGYESAPFAEGDQVGWSMCGAVNWQLGTDLEMPVMATQHWETQALPWTERTQVQVPVPLRGVKTPDDGWMLSMDELLVHRAATMGLVW